MATFPRAHRRVRGEIATAIDSELPLTDQTPAKDIAINEVSRGLTASYIYTVMVVR